MSAPKPLTAADHDLARRYSLRTPCRRCPFRVDVEPYLRTERAEEIARSLHEGAEFFCHETTETVTTEDGDETRAEGPRSRFCAGAMATMEREGNPNQMLRIAGQLGLYDPEKNVDARKLVHRSLSDWVMAHARANSEVPTSVASDGSVVEWEHCGIVDDGCEDPAGYAVGGGVMENAEPPTCDPLTDECEGCARVACSACRSPEWSDETGRFCAMCWNPDEDEDDEDSAE